MRVNVDLILCQSHGQCMAVAPDLFDLDDDDVLHWVETPDEDRRQEVLDAAAVCPVTAITVED
jgi:ferredoxin